MNARIATLAIACFASVTVAADVTSDERAVLQRIDVSRTLATMKPLSEDVVKNRSGAGAPKVPGVSFADAQAAREAWRRGPSKGPRTSLKSTGQATSVNLWLMRTRARSRRHRTSPPTSEFHGGFPCAGS
jgi:hypothetical protein